MAKVLISERFIQLRKPCNCKLAFIEVLSKLDENYSIDTKEYREILTKYEIPLTLDFVGIAATETVVRFDVIKIKQEYGVNISKHTHKIYDLKDAERANLILTNYNKVLMQYYVKNQMHNATPKTYKETDNKYLNSLLEFFDANRIEDSYTFFHTIFSVRDWKQIWPLPRCVTNEALVLYQKFGQSIKQQEQMEVITNQTARVSKWIDTFVYIEAKKRFYLSHNQAEVCLNNPNSTLGYHPKSTHCQQCPMAGECMKVTNQLFSCLANTDLRLSDLRFETAEIAQKRLPKFDLFS